MKVFRTLESFERGRNPVATIGTFDGVHSGHRAILDQLIRSAREVNGESVVISFYPHPRLVLFPDDNPMKLLHTLEEKIEAFEKLGIDSFLIVPFTKEFSRLTSQEFIQKVLVETVGIRKMVTGYDHQFGRNRTGGLQELKAGGLAFGFEVEEIAAFQIEDANVSSTKIRAALNEGDVDTAHTYLGYPYSLSGTVVHGQKLGRTLGFPTANIYPLDPLKLIPSEGVYLVKAQLDSECLYGMLNIGRKPTVGSFPLGIEVNLFDFDRDIYGRKIQISFLHRIREDKKFGSLEELKAAIAGDEQACRAWLAQHTG